MRTRASLLRITRAEQVTGGRGARARGARTARRLERLLIARDESAVARCAARAETHAGARVSREVSTLLVRQQPARQRAGLQPALEAIQSARRTHREPLDENEAATSPDAHPTRRYTASVPPEWSGKLLKIEPLATITQLRRYLVKKVSLQPLLATVGNSVLYQYRKYYILVYL